MNSRLVRLLLPLAPAIHVNELLQAFSTQSLTPSAVHDPTPTGGVGTFPCRVRYDPQAAPKRATSSRWAGSMPGRSHFNPPPTVQESVAAASSQPHVSVNSFHGLPPPQAIPPLPTPGIQPHQSQYHAGYIPSDRVSTEAQGATTGTSQQFGVGSGVRTRGPGGPPPWSGGGSGWGHGPGQGEPPGGGAGLAHLLLTLKG